MSKICSRKNRRMTLQLDEDSIMNLKETIDNNAEGKTVSVPTTPSTKRKGLLKRVFHTKKDSMDGKHKSFDITSTNRKSLSSPIVPPTQQENEESEIDKLMLMSYTNKLTATNKNIYSSGAFSSSLHNNINSSRNSHSPVELYQPAYFYNASSSIPCFQALPNEMKLLIFNYLDAYTLAQASCVCREWRSIMQEKDLWKGKRKAFNSRKILHSISHEDPSTPKNPYRIVLVGAGGVGKSSLTVRFVVGRFVEKYDPTIEDAYRIQVEIDDQVTNLDIIDTAGPEEYSALRDQYIKLGAGFIITYSVTSTHSFQAVSKLRKTILRIKGVQEDDPAAFNIPMIVVGNKLDLERERMVTNEEGQELANKCSNFSKNFFEVSARSNTNVNEIFYEIVRQIDTVEWRKRNHHKRSSKVADRCVVM